MALVAALILTFHLAWLVLVIFGAFWTSHRLVWSAIHILALLLGIVVEVSPWPCPLTLAEQYFGSRAGWPEYHGSFHCRCSGNITGPCSSERVLLHANQGGSGICGRDYRVHARWDSASTHYRVSRTDNRSLEYTGHRISERDH